MDLLSYFDVVKTEKDIKYKTLAEKYAPTKIPDFLGNYKQVKQVDAWFGSKQQKPLLVVGPTGCGKTTLINLFCQKYNKTKYLQNSLKKRTKNELFKYYESVKHFVVHGVFMFDELETVINKSDNISLTDISKWQVNESRPVIRMIFICNDTYINKLTCISAISEVVLLEYPPPKALFSRCLEILEAENIDTDLLKLKETIADMKEPRMIFNSLSLIGIVESKKDSYVDMYGIYRMMLQKDTDLDKKLRYFTCESGTIPIILQENYIDSDLTPEQLCELSDRMSMGDVYHKAIFVNNDPVQMSIYACLSSIYHGFDKAEEQRFYTHPRFGSMWTRMSAMYQKRKYWSRFDEHCRDPYINTTVNVGNMNDIYKSLFSSDKKAFLDFVNRYSLGNVDTAFDLYNAYNVSAKTVTKKSFTTAFTKLLKNSN